jgi:chromosome segregation ATPase
MNLNREENYKVRKLSLTILSKALDDICPKFDREPPETKEQLIKERISFFKAQEKELDREWRELEREAQYELSQFKKDKQQVLKKLEKTRKTSRIKSKIKELEHKKTLRISYLQKKKQTAIKDLQKQLSALNSESKKYKQINKKLNTLVITKVEKSENRYNTIISNTKNSDNGNKVNERIEYSKVVWDRKFNKLKNKFTEREIIHENKRFEQDQIRMAIQDFEEQIELYKHWCIWAGVSLRTCYTSVKDRMNMLGRTSEKIDALLEKIKEEGDPKPL